MVGVVRRIWIAALVAGLAACGQAPPKGEITGPGDQVTLPAPQGGLPTVKITSPAAWPEGGAPNAPAGKYKIEAGMYDAVTGARLRLSDGSDSVIVAEIEIAR